MFDAPRILIEYEMFKASLVFLTMAVLYLVLMYVLWFFKRPEYKKMWKDNPNARISMNFLFGLSAFALYVDCLIGFTDANRWYFLPLVIYCWGSYIALAVLISVLYNKGKKFRERIPGE